MTNTLEEPVNGRLKEREVLLLGKLGMAILDSIVVVFVHKLDHDHEILLLVGVNGVTDSC